ncbi:MAG: precorrin-6A reductase [Candidatus Omnitrophica bacterium]|nr:precorrin-6A reductase [Candidatus Omnitrophota bacterium]
MILVMSGTKDGREITNLLESKGYEVYSTTATEYSSLLSGFERDGVSKPLDVNGLIRLIKDKNISCIVDATHPYADNASKNGIEACERTGIKYIRFERENERLPVSDLIVNVANFEEAAEKAFSLGKRVFLTTGTKKLKVFVEYSKRFNGILIVRTLPWVQSINLCLSNGILPDRIIAIQGPFSKDLNKALFKEHDAEVVVTKESGEAGGVIEKVEAAIELGIPIVVIKRPVLNYPLVVNQYSQVLDELH